jgi:hypothetical protein
MDTVKTLEALHPGLVRTGESETAIVQIDPAASAALAEAIRSARQDLKAEPKAELPKDPEAEVPSRPRLFNRSFVTQAAAALLLIGAGWLASYTGTLGTMDAIRHMEAEAVRSQEILTTLKDDLATLKNTLAAARDVDRTSSTTISDKAKLAEKIDRLAVTLQDPGKKLTALEDRLNRMEGQIMAGLNNIATAKPAVPAPAPAPESETALKPAKAEPLDGWVLREVYNGSALVEGRNRGLYEVMPGNMIPGVGRVEAIERRGARWVVVTDKGFIGTYR